MKGFSVAFLGDVGPVEYADMLVFALREDDRRADKDGEVSPVDSRT